MISTYSLGKKPACFQNPRQQGAVLVLVVAISMLMLGLSTAFLARMRSDTEQSARALGQAQARIMLVAATMYIQETSRIGWEDAAYNAALSDPSDWRNYRTETFGWNDIRTHEVGPRFFDGSAAWTAGVWPAPGTSMRSHMYVMERPPYAIESGNRNPTALFDSEDELDAAYSARGYGGHFHDADADTTGDGGDDPLDGGDIKRKNHWDFADSNSTDYTEKYKWNAHKLGTYHLPDPAPVASGSFSDYAAGNKRPQDYSVGRSWFRIYRETQADHDGDGTPYYDTQDLNGGATLASGTYNASIFVITVGSGGTNGFKDWAEVQSANAEAQFGSSEATFNRLRAGETILWFRVEHSPIVGDTGREMGNLQLDIFDDRRDASKESGSNGMWELDPGLNSAWHTPTQAGSIRWIQRLDRQPPNW